MTEAIEKGIALQPAPGDPLANALAALNAGMNVEEMKSLLGMKKEWDANEDRKAFLQAMAAFKLNPPAILKDRRVQDGIADYRYATLGNVCEQIISAAAAYGFTHRWVPSIGERGEQVITCEVSHVKGHIQNTTLHAPEAALPNGNPLQGDQSINTYLSRYSLLMAFGFAPKDQHDDDGRSGGTPGATDIGEAQHAIDSWVRHAEAALTLEALAGIRADGAKAFNEVGDVAGWNTVKEAIDQRTAELKDNQP